MAGRGLHGGQRITRAKDEIEGRGLHGGQRITWRAEDCMEDRGLN